MTRLGTRAKLEVERARARYWTVDVSIGTLKRYSDDDGGFYAASLTYYMFFSIFPLLLFATAVLGFFIDAELRRSLLESGIQTVPMLRQVFREGTLQSIQDNAGTLALVSLLLALYTGSGGVTALMHALNRVYRVKQEEGFVGKRLKSLKWLGFMAVAAVVTISPTALAEVLGHQQGISRDLIGFGGRVIAAGVAGAVFAVTFRFLPNRKLSWDDVLPGAVLAAVAFEILKFAGSFYVGTSAQGRNATFGAFATAATLLVVSYLLAQVVLVTAELNAVLTERRETRESSQSEDKEAP